MILPFAFLHGTVEVPPSVSERAYFLVHFDSHTCYSTKVQLLAPQRLMDVLETKMKN